MKMGNDNISTLLFAAAIFCAGFATQGWINIFAKNNLDKKQHNEEALVIANMHVKRETIMSKKPKEIYEIYDLEKLLEHVEKMNLNKYHKERILKVIEFEKQVMEMSVYRDLGRERYLELIKEI